jgi:uncharacterized protein YrrD
MTRFREAIGRRVIARDTAEEIGLVSRFLVDLDARVRAVAITSGEVGPMTVGPPLMSGVAGVARLPAPSALLDWTAIAGFGPDAVVAMSGAHLREPATDEEWKALTGGAQLLDRPLMTDAGDIVGTIADVEFDEGGGTVSGFVVDDRTVPLTRLVAVGSFAVIVAARDADAPVHPPASGG